MSRNPSSVAILNSADALGPVVRARRKSQSLRIDDAAALLGVSVDLMSRLENGQGSVRLDKALDVAVAYNGLAKSNVFGLIRALGAETA